MKNQNLLVIVAAALVVGFIVGYLVRQQTAVSSTPQEHTHEEDTKTHASHSHEQKDVSESLPVPTVDLIVQEDPVSGWNAQILTTSFTFAPENVSTEDVPGEGHAHIYIDGVKINRVYSQWYHLGELEPGSYEISATLSTNDHKELTIDGQLIEDIETVNVAEKEMMNGHMMMESQE